MQSLDLEERKCTRLKILSLKGLGVGMLLAITEIEPPIHKNFPALVLVKGMGRTAQLPWFR